MSDVTVVAEEQSLSVLVGLQGQPLTRLEVPPPTIRRSQEEKIAPGDYDDSFESLDLWPKLFKCKPGSVFVTPELDEDGVHILGGLFRAVLPESVIVRSWDGRTYIRDRDYRYEPIFGKIAAIDGRLETPGREKLLIECQYATQRLDLVQVDNEGRFGLKPGEPRMVCPQLPLPDEGARPVAGVYVAPWKRDGAYVISQEDIYNVRPEASLDPCNLHALHNSRSNLEKGVELRIAFLGDSVTLGAEAGEWWKDLWTAKNPTYVSRFVVGLQDMYPTATIKPLHAAQGGATTEAASNLFEDVIAPSKPDLLIIAFGLNDAGGKIGEEPLVPPLRYKENIRKIVSRAREEGTEVILVSPMQPNPWLKCGMAQRVPAYCGVLLDLATEEDVAYADVYLEWMRQEARGIAPFSQLHNCINHPGPGSHAIYSDTLLRFFERDV